MRHLRIEPLLMIMAILIGLDPAKDIRWVETLYAEPMELFTEGKIDAFPAFPPALRKCVPVTSAT